MFQVDLVVLGAVAVRHLLEGLATLQTHLLRVVMAHLPHPVKATTVEHQ